MTLPLDLHTPAVADALGAAAGTDTGPASRGTATTPMVAVVAGPVLEIHVLGQPAPQGSKHGRPIYNGRGDTRVFTGKVAQVESSKNVWPWREAVKHAARDVIASREHPPFVTLDEALYVETTFTFIRPKNHYRTGRNAHLLRADAPTWPISKGRNDIEKLVRATRDALTDAGIWTDDALVVDERNAKCFPSGHRDALPLAGAVIRIYRMGTS